MAIYAVAVQKPIVRNYGGVRPRTTCAILHVDAGGANSLQGWFNNPASSASSHFYVKYDGTVEQYLDTKYIAWTQRAGNAYGIGIETQGLGSGTWTDAQMASIAALLKWINKVHGVLLTDMGNSKKSSRGVGYHRMGCDPWRLSGADVWGPRGKVCPGDGRVAQFDAVVRAAGGATIPVTNPVNPGNTVPELNAGFSKAHITWVQQELKKLGFYKDVVDGVRGPNTQAAIKAFQKSRGLVQDGLPGPLTTNALKGIKPAQPSNALALDGNFGPASVKRLQASLGTTQDGVISGQGTADAKYHPAFKSIKYGPGGSDVVRALQRKLGVTADGYLGPNTIKALQRYLGIKQDGYFGPTTAKTLQARLNAGTF